jgi:hypothetical protein
MITVRDKLEEILPFILPDKPEDAINGADLSEKVMEKWPEANRDSIRQYFSVMHSDPTSILAKIPGKHGYYKRPQLSSEQSLEGLQPKEVKIIEQAEVEASKRDEQREEKFRSIFMRYNELTSGLFSMNIEHTKGKKGELGLNKWKYPDVVLLNWEVGEMVDEEYSINNTMLEVRKSLGEQPFKLISNELKSELRFTNFRENFFQCVSNSKWSHVAQLSIANDITDSKLVLELSRLGKSYDVTITTFGLTGEQVDSFPSARDILEMTDSEFDSISQLVNISYINIGRERESLDWEHLKDLKQQNPDFNDLFHWISKCLSGGKAYKFKDFKKLREIENRY